MLGTVKKGARHGLVTQFVGSVEPRSKITRNVNGAALSPAIQTHLAPADLGRPAPRDRLAQADRRRVGLRRELGAVRLPRPGQRRRRRRPGRCHASRSGPLRAASELLGQAFGPRDQFPLLVKFIDAHQALSVQVHPDDETGRRLANDNGKTETWVILDTEPGSLIYAGLKAGRRP